MPNENIAKITNKVENIKSVMHENIEKATQNCIKLESLELKSEELMKDAGVFQTNARNIKNKMWWKNVKMWSILIGIISVVIVIIACVIYFNNSNTTS